MENNASIVRLAANETGETQCVIFVDSIQSARSCLTPHLASIVGAYPFIGAFGARVFVHKLDDLKKLPCVKAVAPHTTVTTCLHKTKAVLGVETAQKASLYGGGIGVAVIDTGVRPHVDFMMPAPRIYFRDFIAGRTLPYDDNGHGTAVASILCGNGLASGGRFSGIAPKSRLFALKAIGASGEGGAFVILEAMQWLYDNAAKHNIKVLCASFGSQPVQDGLDPLSAGAEALWRKGITVVASAGNDGPKPDTVRSPGCNSSIITVGGAHLTKSGAEVAEFSSRGLCAGFTKPDLVAPASNITACGVTDDYETHTGTSMAAPITAGAAALILSKRPDFSPNRVKEILLKTAQKMPALPRESAGHGLLSFDFLEEL
ncbi:MAG: S8 family serine peptidase [Firmicutes bacterium]|nr:S8 family serine peptidase [Bacillota bacterium]